MRARAISIERTDVILECEHLGSHGEERLSVGGLDIKRGREGHDQLRELEKLLALEIADAQLGADAEERIWHIESIFALCILDL